MQLNETLARQIVSRAMKILSFSAYVMDERGLIIGSGLLSYLLTPISGALMSLAPVSTLMFGVFGLA